MSTTILFQKLEQRGQNVERSEIFNIPDLLSLRYVLQGTTKRHEENKTSCIENGNTQKDGYTCRRN
jgi:hypothetical protein